MKPGAAWRTPSLQVAPFFVPPHRSPRCPFRNRFVNRRDFALRTPAALAATVAVSSLAPLTSRAADIRMDPRAAYELAATGHGFSVGPMMAAHPVYVFFDTTCPHCAHLWESVKPLLGKVKLVWMPVGLLRPQSTPQGATILAAANPAAAMAENEARLTARQGGITAARDLSDAVIAKVKANTALFDKIGADGVPLVLFRNARTGQYGVHSSSADTATLAGLLGL